MATAARTRLRQYEVTVLRQGYGVVTLLIHAEGPSQAEDLALEAIGESVDCAETVSTYEVVSIEERREDD